MTFTPVQIAAFIKRSRQTSYAKFSGETLKRAVQWFLAHGGLFLATSGDKIVAVVLVRRVLNADEAFTAWTWNAWGTRLCVDLAISRHPRGLKACVKEIAWRFPTDKVFWRRCGRGSNRLREYPFGRAAALVTKGTSDEPRFSTAPTGGA